MGVLPDCNAGLLFRIAMAMFIIILTPESTTMQ
jgi:hypothetical protein